MDFGELYRWFENRPKWLQDCARRLIEKGPLSQQDYTDLLAICKNEAVGKTVNYSGIPEDAFALQQTTKPIRLDSISNVQGINALRSDKSLEFGKNPVCIIYRRNGSGKSGYVRLLKQACGVRNPGDLLTNVFIAGDQSQAAEFAYTYEAKEKTFEWSGKPIEELQGS